VISSNGFCFLPGRSHLVTLRKQREKISQNKWQIAQGIGIKLKLFPTIQAVFVTGSLAMNNAAETDDIDLMIVTSANTLWITRFFVDLYLKFMGIRRPPPEHLVLSTEHFANKVCDNLWLDENHLSIVPHDLYRAHEIMQAKVLWGRNHIHDRFLAANFWVKQFLPNAYPATLRLPHTNLLKPILLSYLLPVNWLFYVVQYLYMRPKMTTEKIAPGFAFFHPKKS
jgi:hypothetical protein